jgi:hypothetical protein
MHKKKKKKTNINNKPFQQLNNRKKKSEKLVYKLGDHMDLQYLVPKIPTKQS